MAGKLFVGPAGRVLDEALADVGVDRGAVYLTNAVKPFSFQRAEGSKRRIHQRAKAGEITACRPWLAAELAAVRLALVVCMGAVAATALLGPSFRVTEHRGSSRRTRCSLVPSGPIGCADAGGLRAVARLHEHALSGAGRDHALVLQFAVWGQRPVVSLMITRPTGTATIPARSSLPVGLPRLTVHPKANRALTRTAGSSRLT